MTIAYEQACDADFDALARIRIAAMRESLEAVGRFDPERARERLRAGFRPQDTQHIVLSGARVGFFALTRHHAQWSLDHLYLVPEQSGQGTGSRVMAEINRRADTAGALLKVGALRGSRSNRFYASHGFRIASEDTYDIYYVRDPQPVS